MEAYIFYTRSGKLKMLVRIQPSAHEGSNPHHQDSIQGYKAWN